MEKIIRTSDTKATRLPYRNVVQVDIKWYEDDKYAISYRDHSLYRPISKRFTDLTLDFIMYFKEKYYLPAAVANKTLIHAADAQKGGYSHYDSRLESEQCRLINAHFPNLASCRSGTFGIPGIIQPLANILLKHTVPLNLSKRHNCYTRANIVTLFDGRHDMTPQVFGGSLELQDLLDVKSLTGWKTIREYGKEHGFEDWEIEKIEKMYNRN